jgi:hypothetical protein
VDRYEARPAVQTFRVKKKTLQLSSASFFLHLGGGGRYLKTYFLYCKCINLSTYLCYATHKIPHAVLQIYLAVPSLTLQVHFLKKQCLLNVSRFPVLKKHRSSLRVKESSSYPVTGHGSPQSCDTSRLPRFLDNQLTDGCKVSALYTSHLLLPGKSLVLISVRC